MNYIEYMKLNPFQRFWHNFSNGLKAFPKKLAGFFIAIGRFFVNFFVGISKAVAGYFVRFFKGDWAVKISYAVMGFGNIVRGQIVKGLLFLAVEVGYIFYMIKFGLDKILLFDTLGDVPGVEKYNPKTYNFDFFPGDKSREILLYGILTIMITAVFVFVYFASTKSAYKTYESKVAGEKIPTFLEELKDLFDNKFHVTLLAFPTLTIAIFTIIPMLFMILMAFTNYDYDHLGDGGKLFTWVGLQNFTDIFDVVNSKTTAFTFAELTKWTIIWAIFATFLNYIFGMILALMINKKGIKLKSLWRTLFVVTIAVPQFISLLLMNQMLEYNYGAINVLLKETLHLIPNHINFLGESALLTRITIIVVNCWVGIPYTILITSGILMNIPADLYESATIDGAGPVKSFMKITLPYMLFVTTPYLITTFIGNINNFNVIFLLTNGTGGYRTQEYHAQAASGDLLVTWLFKLTQNIQDYKLAATIGILVFVVSATLSLVTFNLTKSAKNEEDFS